MACLSKQSQEWIYVLIDTVVGKYLKKAELNPESGSGNPFVTAIFEDFEPLLHRIHGAKTSLGNEMEKIAEIVSGDAWGKENVKRKINIDVSLPKNVFQIIDIGLT